MAFDNDDEQSYEFICFFDVTTYFLPTVLCLFLFKYHFLSCSNWSTFFPEPPSMDLSGRRSEFIEVSAVQTPADQVTAKLIQGSVSN